MVSVCCMCVLCECSFVCVVGFGCVLGMLGSVLMGVLCWLCNWL